MSTNRFFLITNANHNPSISINDWRFKNILSKIAEAIRPYNATIASVYSMSGDTSPVIMVSYSSDFNPDDLQDEIRSKFSRDGVNFTFSGDGEILSLQDMASINNKTAVKSQPVTHIIYIPIQRSNYGKIDPENDKVKGLIRMDVHVINPLIAGKSSLENAIQFAIQQNFAHIKSKNMSQEISSGEETLYFGEPASNLLDEDLFDHYKTLGEVFDLNIEGLGHFTLFDDLPDHMAAIPFEVSVEGDRYAYSIDAEAWFENASQRQISSLIKSNFSDESVIEIARYYARNGNWGLNKRLTSAFRDNEKITLKLDREKAQTWLEQNKIGFLNPNSLQDPIHHGMR